MREILEFIELVPVRTINHSIVLQQVSFDKYCTIRVFYEAKVYVEFRLMFDLK